jgi:antitoxin component YwqK of YwqJK toxin-antitoxin module
MKQLLFIITICFSCSNSTQVVTEERSNFLDPVDPGNKGLFLTQVVTEERSNFLDLVDPGNKGVLYLKHNMNIFSGIAYSNYKNGKLKNEKKYINGRWTGFEKTYYEDGQNRTYKEDKKLIEKRWFPDGKIYMDSNKDGFKLYYQNGSLQMEQKIVNGKVVWVKAWYEHGQLSEMREFNQNRDITSEACWDHSGNEMDCSKLKTNRY